MILDKKKEMRPIEISELIYKTKNFSLFTHASRLAFFDKISKIMRGLVVLDIGAGLGGTSYYFCKNGNRVYSFDLDYRVLSDCGMLMKDKEYLYWHRICGDARHLPFKKETFDLVIMSEVIYLIADLDLEKVLDEIKLVLRNQGMVLISQCNLLNVHLLKTYFKSIIKPLFGFRKATQKGRVFNYPSYKLIKLLKNHFRIIGEYGIPSLGSQINYYLNRRKSINSFSHQWFTRHFCYSYLLIGQKKY